MENQYLFGMLKVIGSSVCTVVYVSRVFLSKPFYVDSAEVIFSHNLLLLYSSGFLKFLFVFFFCFVFFSCLLKLFSLALIKKVYARSEKPHICVMEYNVLSDSRHQ